MRFERENANPVVNPSAHRLTRELSKLRSAGPSSFASLTADCGDYVQAAGGGGGCVVEKRIAAEGRQFRAHQDTPVVPFADGTELCFSGGRIALRRNEWFRLTQVIEIFAAFLEGKCPRYVRWREITGELAFRGRRSQ